MSAGVGTGHVQHSRPALIGTAAAPAVGRHRTRRWGTSRPVLAEHTQFEADTTCGPRCVHFILDRNDIRVTFDELAEKIQGAGRSTGSSLAAMERALNKRGVHTRAITLDRGERLDSSEPAILHWAADRPGGLGHFVVQLPVNDPDHPLVWAGLGGWQTGPAGDLAARRTGTVLLTSRTPFNPDTRPVVTGSLHRLQPGALGSVILLTLWTSVLVRGECRRLRATSQPAVPLVARQEGSP